MVRKNDNEAGYQSQLQQLEAEEKEIRARLGVIAGDKAVLHARITACREAALEPLRERERQAAAARKLANLTEWAATNPGEAQRTLKARRDELKRHEEAGNTAGVEMLRPAVEQLSLAVKAGLKKRGEIVRAKLLA